MCMYNLFQAFVLSYPGPCHMCVLSYPGIYVLSYPGTFFILCNQVRVVSFRNFNSIQAQQHDNHKHKLISSSSGTGYPVGWGGNEHKAEEQDVQDTKERLIYSEQLFMKLLEVTQVTKLDVSNLILNGSHSY